MPKVRALDTSSDAHDAQLIVYKAMAPGERVRLAIEMSEQAVARSAAGIRARHPDYSNQDVGWASRRMRLGDQLFRAAWPDAPLVDP
jgi:hypothetical protein